MTPAQLALLLSLAKRAEDPRDVAAAEIRQLRETVELHDVAYLRCPACECTIGPNNWRGACPRCGNGTVTEVPCALDRGPETEQTAIPSEGGVMVRSEDLKVLIRAAKALERAVPQHNEGCAIRRDAECDCGKSEADEVMAALKAVAHLRAEAPHQ